MDESELDIAQVILIHHSLIKRGWAWKMPVSYQELARRYIEFDFLNDIQPERSRMKPKIQITTCHGFVTKVKSEGTEIEVGIMEEDTGKGAASAPVGSSSDLDLPFTVAFADRGHMLSPCDRVVTRRRWVAESLGGRLAQLVEQLTLNQRVKGSSPLSPPILSRT